MIKRETQFLAFQKRLCKYIQCALYHNQNVKCVEINLSACYLKYKIYLLKTTRKCLFIPFLKKTVFYFILQRPGKQLPSNLWKIISSVSPILFILLQTAFSLLNHSHKSLPRLHFMNIRIISKKRTENLPQKKERKLLVSIRDKFLPFSPSAQPISTKYLILKLSSATWPKKEKNNIESCSVPGTRFLSEEGNIS